MLKARVSRCGTSEPGADDQGQLAAEDGQRAFVHVSQEGMTVVEGGDTALARTRVTATLKAGERYDVVRRATYVFKRDARSEWLCAVDNSYGTDLLDAEGL